MTHDDKVAAIVAAIADPNQLMLLMRAAVTKALPDVDDGRLDQLMALLGLTQ